MRRIESLKKKKKCIYLFKVKLNCFTILYIHVICCHSLLSLFFTGFFDDLGGTVARELLAGVLTYQIYLPSFCIYIYIFFYIFLGYLYSSLFIRAFDYFVFFCVGLVLWLIKNICRDQIMNEEK
jgi:hypothetical protein